MSKRWGYLIGMIGCYLMMIPFGIIIGTNISKQTNETKTIVMIMEILVVIFALVGGVFAFLLRLQGGLYQFPYGEIKIHFQDGAIYVEWEEKSATGVNLTRVAKTKPNKVKLIKDHLYVEESKTNSLWLPKEVLPFLEEHLNVGLTK